MSPSVWRIPDFRRLLGALVVSQAGTRVAREALPLTAVLVLGAGPIDMGFLTVAATFPTLLMALHAGAVLDRVRRRPTMIAADLLRFLVLLSVPLAAFFGALGMVQLCLVAFAVAALTLAFDVADQAYLPGLVGREQVLAANAAKEATGSAAEIAGPPLGGLLVQAIGGPLTILIDAISYLASGLLLGRIREVEAVAAASARGPGMVHEIREGIRFLWRDPVLRPLLFARVLRTVFGSLLGPFYVLFAVTELGLSPLSLGFVIAAGGIASLTGAALAPRLLAVLPAGPGLVLAFAVKTLGLACVPLAGLFAGVSPLVTILLLVAQQLLADGSTGFFSVVERTLRQRRVPGAILGRAVATIRLVNDGPVPFAALLGGVIAEAHGIEFVLWLAVAGYALSPVVAFFSAVRRLRAV